jgi:hypothetical protein
MPAPPFRRCLRATTVIAAALAAACTMNEDERRVVLERAQQENYEISRDSVVQDMRSPPDTGRLVYDSAVSLSEHAASATGAAPVWAPFGIAQPDTVAGESRSRSPSDSTPPRVLR